jgi:serine/threonine-protein kinase
MHSSGPARAAAHVPERIGRYEILLPIASGGMATVYLARTRGIGGFEREVALKLTHPHLRETQEFASHLLEEAKLAVGIRHQNVVPVLDVDDDPNGLFLVMDYVHGDTLGGLRKKAALPPRVGIRILLDALAGLHAAHELKDERGEPLQIVHRDFSPQNILVGADGVSRLTDFGIAKAATRLSNTSTGLVKGKAAYMAPEQARSQTLDRRCDVWAAGIIAWEILAERRLYDQDDLATLLKVVSEPPPRLRTVHPLIPAEVEEAVADALAMKVDDRTPTAAAFARALATACARCDLLAETEEVAAFVERVAGPKLADRRRRAKEILQARGLEIIPVPDPSLEPTQVQERPPVAPPVLSRPPARPQVGQTTLPDVTVPLDAAPVQLSDEDVIAESTRTDTNAISTHAVEDFVAPPRPPPKGLVVGVAAAVGMLGLLLIVVSVSSSNKGPTSAASTSPITPQSAVVTASPPQTAVAAPAETPATTSLELPSLLVHANATIRELKIDGRAVDAPPGRDIRVDLFPDESTRATHVVASTSDGRQASATVPPGAKMVVLEFPPKQAGTSAKPAVAPPLATNPYVKP